MAEPAADHLVPRPTAGRVFEQRRRTRFGDVAPDGGARLDALVTYLQDLGGEDTVDAGLGDDLWWVVRRTVVEVRRAPSFFEDLDLATWCSGLGGRWAERRVAMTGNRGARVDAAVLWVRIDQDTGRALRLTQEFLDVWGDAAGGRQVSARLQHPDPPADAAGERPWTLRGGDFDLLGHVNNAAAWAMVDDERLRRGEPRTPYRAELEYRLPVEPGADIRLLTVEEPGGGFRLWAVGRPAPGDADVDATDATDVVFTTGRVVPLPG